MASFSIKSTQNSSKKAAGWEAQGQTYKLGLYCDEEGKQRDAADPAGRFAQGGAQGRSLLILLKFRAETAPGVRQTHPSHRPQSARRIGNPQSQGVPLAPLPPQGLGEVQPGAVRVCIGGGGRGGGDKGLNADAELHAGEAEAAVLVEVAVLFGEGEGGAAAAEADLQPGASAGGRGLAEQIGAPRGPQEDFLDQLLDGLDAHDRQDQADELEAEAAGRGAGRRARGAGGGLRGAAVHGGGAVRDGVLEQAQGDQLPLRAQEDPQAHLRGRAALHQPARPRGEDPELPRPPQHRAALRLLLRRGLALPHPRALLRRQPLQLPPHLGTFLRGAHAGSHQAGLPRGGVHARQRYHPPRYQAREHPTPREHHQGVRLRLVHPLAPAPRDPLRHAALLLARSGPETAVRQQGRRVEHRYSHLRAALRTRALRDQDRRGPGQGDRRGHLLFQGSPALRRCQALRTQLSPQKPQGKAPHEQTGRPPLHPPQQMTSPHQQIFQYLPSLSITVIQYFQREKEVRDYQMDKVTL